jgi:hypothetical protein
MTLLPSPVVELVETGEGRGEEKASAGHFQFSIFNSQLFLVLLQNK